MKNWNLHLIMTAVILFAVVSFNWRYGHETIMFFGFAENKEMEVRLEHAVTVNQVLVTPGQRVSKGDVLLEVTRSGLKLEESSLNLDVAKLQSEHQLWESGVHSNISRLEAEKAAKISEIQSEIQQLESEMNINKSLLKGLKSLKTDTEHSASSPNEIRIQGLKRELELAVRPLNAEIKKLTKELYNPDNPLLIQLKKLQNELGFVNEETSKMTVTATSDGVVGTVSCKAGEQVQGFTNLLTFYEEKPTLVKGYVLESLLLHVKEGDSLQVSSSVMAGSNCVGKVVGMGSRIVEIPERLRKIPEFKTYGREVLIKIPAENHFLQNEKVVLKMLLNGDGSMQVLKAFTPPNAMSSVEKERKNS